MKKSVAIFLLAFTVFLGSFAPAFDQTAAAAYNSEKLIKLGYKYLGTHYRYGGKSPKGFDCSGFVGYVFKKQAGIQLSPSANGLYHDKKLKSVSKKSLKKGDLVFFKTRNDGKAASHVGIYIGNGKFIHSSTSRGVVTSKLSQKYYKARYKGAKRI